MSLADREHLPKVVTDVDGIRDILLALDPEIVILREDISQLIKELYIATTEKYIDRWEQDFSLPYDGTLTLEQRRQRVKNKLARKKVLNWQNLRLLIKNNIVKPRFYIVNEAENYHFKIFLEQQPQRQEFDLSKFTVVGSPTITEDGVASGFSKENHILFNIAVNSYNMQIKLRYTWNGIKPPASTWIFRGGENAFSGSDTISIFQGINGRIEIYFVKEGVEYYNGNGVYIEPNIPVDIILSKTENTFGLKVIQNGKVLSDLTKDVSTSYFSNLMCTINGFTDKVLQGSIDLKQFSITVDGKEVFNGIKNIDYITNELRTSLNQAKPAYLTFDLIVTEFFTRYCGTFSSGTEPL